MLPQPTVNDPVRSQPQISKADPVLEFVKTPYGEIRITASALVAFHDFVTYQRPDLLNGSRNDKLALQEFLELSKPVCCHSAHITPSHDAYLYSKGVVIAIRNQVPTNFYDEELIWKRSHTPIYSSPLDCPIVYTISSEMVKRKKYRTYLTYLKEYIFIPARELDDWINIYMELFSQYPELNRFTNVTQKYLREQITTPFGDKFGSIKFETGIVSGYFVKLSKTNRYYPWYEDLAPRMAKDYIYSGDPIFQKCPEIKPVFKKNIVAEFTVNNVTLRVNGHTIRQLASRFPKSILKIKWKGSELDKVVDVSQSNGNGVFLQLVYEMLKRAVQVERKNAVRQIIDYNFEKASYVSYANWIFVISEDNVVLTCYEKDGLKSAGYRQLES